MIHHQTQSSLEDIHGGEFICRGIVWRGRRAFIDVVTTDRTVIKAALTGHTLAWESVDGRRYCTGRYVVKDRFDFIHEPCSHSEVASRGWQCERCARSDDFRFAHILHLSRMQSHLGDYLSQTHWLYIATFSSGTTKVGTAVDNQKLNRLDEQGPALATYVARADDGWVVRDLESLVSKRLNLRQAVTSKSKVLGLVSPHEESQLQDVHQGVVDRVMLFLERQATLPGFVLVNEAWKAPSESLEILASNPVGNRAVYELNDAGPHVLSIAGCAGSTVIDLGGDSGQIDTHLVADLSRTRGIRCRLVEASGRNWRQGVLQY